eukprot:3103158-Amphidinium_carterae.1
MHGTSNYLMPHKNSIVSGIGLKPGGFRTFSWSRGTLLQNFGLKDDPRVSPNQYIIKEDADVWVEGVMNQ